MPVSLILKIVVTIVSDIRLDVLPKETLGRWVVIVTTPSRVERVRWKMNTSVLR